MAQDLAAVAPSAIVCVAFLIGAWLLVRKELAPKRAARSRARQVADKESEHESEHESARE
jgi:hypothetical protein